ncbi:MAG: hypothetical protein AAF434_20385 [Pseudomonadota bacterium]
MNTRFNNLIQAFNTSGLRQRVMVMSAVVITLHAAWDYFIYQPNVETHAQMAQSIIASSERFEVLNRTLTEVSQANAQDNSEMRQLQDQIDTINDQISQVTSDFIAPEQMPEVLKQLLKDNKNLRITLLKTEPARRLNAPEDHSHSSINESENSVTVIPAAQQASQTPIFRHNMTVGFEGDYLNALTYIQSVENLGWRIFWDSVEIDGSDYPNAYVTVSLYTLSLMEDWIGV